VKQWAREPLIATDYPILQILWGCNKGNIEPAQAGAEREIACATFDATDFLLEKMPCF